MVKKEYFLTREDGIKLYRSYSDEQFYIQKVGTDEIYSEAVDVETTTYEYVETDEKIKEEPMPPIAPEVMTAMNEE